MDSERTVNVHVRRLRESGMPCERVVVLIKEAVREAFPPTLSITEGRDLLSDIVPWIVAAYYEGHELGAKP